MITIRKINKSELRRLLRIRKSKKKYFVHPYVWRRKRIRERWRKPRGIDNKIRMQFKEYPPLVKIGYRGPKAVRYLHPSGKEEVLVYNVQDLYNIDPQTQVVRIARTVGIKKRLRIINFANKFGIRVLNLGRAEAYIGFGEEEVEKTEETELEEEAVKETFDETTEEL